MTLYIICVLYVLKLLLYEIRYKNVSTSKYHSKALGVSSTADLKGAYWAPGPTGPRPHMFFGALWSPMEPYEEKIYLMEPCGAL